MSPLRALITTAAPLFAAVGTQKVEKGEAPERPEIQKPEVQKPERHGHA